jgi:hypothetical protein
MLRRWATASRKFMLEAIVVVGLLLVEVKDRKGVFARELENGMAALARETLNGLYTPLRRVGSSGAVIAMARTRRARRNAVLVRIICCKA